MLDLKYVIDNLAGVKAKLSTRGGDFSYLDQLVVLQNERKNIILEVENLKAKRNELSKLIGEYKRQQKDTTSIFEQVNGLGDSIKTLDLNLNKIDQEILSILENTPNIPDETTPIGASETDNLEIKKYLEPTKFNFEPLDHVALGQNLNIIDFESAAKITGTRFSVLKGLGARLERALINFMSDLHVYTHNYTEVIPPYIVNADSLYATGQFPKFKEDVFKVGNNEWYLNPTAEVPTINIYRDMILELNQLPIRHCAFTTAFRSEAGSAGRDTRGLLRQHQFNKVELIKITTPESSDAEHEAMLLDACKVLELLKLPYRVVTLCTYDLGFVMRKTYDIEVWLPGQNTYREIASISNAGDYQARRANIRFKREKAGKTQYVHTLNGSGLAVGRTLIAVLENYQKQDGTIEVPEVLIPYMKVEKIT